MPGSRDIERRIKSLVRWNALAMVVRANKAEDGIGGHISTFASAATLYEVGFNHFFRGQRRRQRRRRHLLPGPRGARHLRARVSRRAPRRDAARELPPRAEAGRRPVVVSASVADARLLGISRRSRWASARSWRSTRRASCATSRIAASSRSRTRRSGRSSATARPTSPNRSARSRCRRAKSSTT